MISLPLDKLLPILAQHLSRYPSAKVSLKREVMSLDQDEDSAWDHVRTPDGEAKFGANYVVGYDGANIKVPHELFGNSFPSFTWNKQIVATNVRFA